MIQITLLFLVADGYISWETFMCKLTSHFQHKIDAGFDPLEVSELEKDVIGGTSAISVIRNRSKKLSDWVVMAG